MEKITDKEKQSLYLDYVNNYLTVKVFALDKWLTEADALEIIEEWRKINEKQVIKK